MEQTSNQQLIMSQEAIQAIIQGLASNEALATAIADKVSARTQPKAMGSSTTASSLPPASSDINTSIQDPATTPQSLVTSGSSSIGSRDNTTTINTNTIVTSTGTNRPLTDPLRGEPFSQAIKLGSKGGARKPQGDAPQASRLSPSHHEG